ncbi:MAG TPA: AbrB/MazE/SpoVT family DNA-binding domain-containing protein [Ktedonobacteraceae bacterium]|nr:AbrB/MazE/SpoVT family DNA-binding domain-containing protein [Ktedonobacteraceae bacterium]
MDSITMEDFETEVSETGQITIPQEIRDIMGLQPHDTVRFEIDDGTVIIRRVSSKLMHGYGAIRARNYPEDYQELRKAFEEGIAGEADSEYH